MTLHGTCHRQVKCLISHPCLRCDLEKFYTSRFCCASPLVLVCFVSVRSAIFQFLLSRLSDFARNGSLVRQSKSQLIKLHKLLLPKLIGNSYNSALIARLSNTYFCWKRLNKHKEKKNRKKSFSWRLESAGKMSVILKIDPSKKDVIINNNHNGITINNNNVSKRKSQLRSSWRQCKPSNIYKNKIPFA